MIRFLDSTKTIREEFVDSTFVRMEQQKQLFIYKDLITGAVADLGLSMVDCRGQCYDARLLRHTERQISTQNKILYIVENSITLLLSLMLFWFVCVNKQK